ncbi:MAG: M43 family zinc metalloprotease [Acidobacteria bacterium]|nr:M43 family zinc metalloprotease [Acidobacteriota bacterium]
MPSLTAFLLATILALAIMPAPQSQDKTRQEKKTECGTEIPPEQLEVELARKNIPALTMGASTETPYYLPITAHIVHRSDGTGGNTPEQVEVVMQGMNQLWAQVGIQFFIYGEIDHINNDTHFDVPNNRAAHQALKKVNVVGNTINVYFTRLGPLCGVSSYTSDSVQGVLMDITSLGCSGPSAFAHEIGHYFNLHHTHETWLDSNGIPTKVECPNGSNCSTAGDLLCDTPADPGLLDPNGLTRVNGDCSYDNSAFTPTTCDTTQYTPLTNNLMSYSIHTCRNQFTGDQISKVLQVLSDAGNRKNLITSGKRYVDPLANPNNTSCIISSPCRTLAKAIQVSKNGELIYLKPGAYQASSFGDKRLTLNRWGTAGVVEIQP